MNVLFQKDKNPNIAPRFCRKRIDTSTAVKFLSKHYRICQKDELFDLKVCENGEPIEKTSKNFHLVIRVFCDAQSKCEQNIEKRSAKSGKFYCQKQVSLKLR